MLTDYVEVMLVVTGICLLVALYTDLSSKKIPNILCLVILFIGVATQTFFNGASGLGLALLGSGIALLILLPVYIFKILGAGDVKLMVALGAFAGPELIVWAIAYGIVFGIFTSVLIGIYQTGFSGLKATLKRYYYSFFLRKYLAPVSGELASTQVAYAPALALGWFWALSHNPDVQWVLSSFRYSLGI